jgi:hypothetical protein
MIVAIIIIVVSRTRPLFLIKVQVGLLHRGAGNSGFMAPKCVCGPEFQSIRR